VRLQKRVDDVICEVTDSAADNRRTDGPSRTWRLFGWLSHAGG
jgi:hypothetical protein